MMQTSWIDIKGTDGSFGGYLALPPTGKGPGIVLFQEIFGVNRHIRAVAEQYAMDGFVVLTPDVFWRQAPRVELGYEGDDMTRARALMGGITPAQAITDVQSTVAALRARPEVTGKVGAVGYCMGGRLAYFAAATAGVDAASAWYGGGIQDNLDKAASVKCPMQFQYAENDHAIPLEAVEKVKAAFAGKKAEFHIYAGAGHGFNCWDRGAYHQPSAALAHGRTLEFFVKNLA
jgi:carboxymethylenebutenolidase